MSRRDVLVQWLDGDERQQVLRRSTTRALAIVAVEVLGYLACVALALAPLPYWVSLLGGILAGHAIAILFVAGHDACHQALTPHQWLNRWIGRLVFIPSLHCASLWILSHNRIHHAWTCLRGRDYVWEPMSPADFAAASPSRRRL